MFLSIPTGYKQTKGLHFTNINIPEVADYRDSVSLSCSYDMANHTLNSVKWYKDDKEFYRLVNKYCAYYFCKIN